MGLVVLALASTVSVMIDGVPEPGGGDIWLSASAMSLTMILASIVIMLALSRGKLGLYGFGRPRRTPWGWLVFIGLGLGAGSTVIGTLAGVAEHAMAAEFSTLQVIVLIWIGASVGEEFLARGVVQGFLQPLAGQGFNVGRLRLSYPMIVSAMFFGAMHLGLLTMGMPTGSVMFIVGFATLLGLAAAWYREQTGSLWPAVVIHALGNIGGSVAGWLI